MTIINPFTIDIPEEQIDDLHNANLYKVTICNDNITHSLLYIN